jgi:glycerol-3-phosphate cytidylyltransferase-like family protein
LIVSTDQLPTLVGEVAMVDGGFDPIHEGHVRSFETAATLGVRCLGTAIVSSR